MASWWRLESRPRDDPNRVVRELTGDELETAYTIAGRLRAETRFDQGRYWGSQAIRLAIAGSVPLFCYFVLHWHGVLIALVLVVDAWAVFFGDRLVSIYAERPARMARHLRGLKRTVLIAASAARRLRRDSRPGGNTPAHGLVSSDFPPTDLMSEGYVIAAVLFLPTFVIVALALVMGPRIEVDPRYLAGAFLFTIALRLFATVRVVSGARAGRNDLFDLLPQAGTTGWAFYFGCLGAMAPVLILPKSEVNRLPEFVLALAFLGSYLAAAFALGIANWRRNAREDRAIAEFLERPLEEYVDGLHVSEAAGARAARAVT